VQWIEWWPPKCHLCPNHGTCDEGFVWKRDFADVNRLGRYFCKRQKTKSRRSTYGRQGHVKLEAENEAVYIQVKESQGWLAASRSSEKGKGPQKNQQCQHLNENSGLQNWEAYISVV
jgi:hypothetical protein